MNKLTLIGIVLVLLIIPINALTLKSESASYEKGQELIFSGNCDEGKLHKIRGELDNAEIFEDQINCFDSKFSFKYKTTFLDPSGNWKIYFFTQENETVLNETQINLIVKPISDSSYYRITFLSPSGFSFKRAETILITIELTDSGKIVDDAVIVMYDSFGRKINLKPEGNGVYDINYSIPFNAVVGEWEIIILAENQKEGKIFGGERKLAVTITEALFNFNIIEPSLQTYEQSDTIPIKFETYYSNGVKLTQSKIKSAELIVGNQKIPLEINSENELFLAYNPTFAGNQTLIFSVTDNSGNKGEEKVNLVVTCSLTCMIKSYGLIVLVVVLLIIIFSKLFYAKIKYSLQLNSLKKEKEKNLQLIKNLQEEYFSKGIMPSKSYKSNLNLYKTRLIIAESKLKQLLEKIEREK